MSQKHGGRYEDGAVARWLSSESLSKPWEIQPSFEKEPVIHTWIWDLSCLSLELVETKGSSQERGEPARSDISSSVTSRVQNAWRLECWLHVWLLPSSRSNRADMWTWTWKPGLGSETRLSAHGSGLPWSGRGGRESGDRKWAPPQSMGGLWALPRTPGAPQPKSLRCTGHRQPIAEQSVNTGSTQTVCTPSILLLPTQQSASWARTAAGTDTQPSLASPTSPLFSSYLDCLWALRTGEDSCS